MNAKKWIIDKKSKEKKIIENWIKKIRKRDGNYIGNKEQEIFYWIEEKVHIKSKKLKISTTSLKRKKKYKCKKQNKELVKYMREIKRRKKFT